MVKYEFKDFKTVLKVMKYADSWFWCKYIINCYNGCEHACIYCDTRSFKYYLHQDFGQTIYIKTIKGQPIGKALDDRLRRARTLLPDITIIGSAGDAYQPAEIEYGNTRQILHILLKHKYPLSILTKSDLIQNDLDLISKIAKVSWAAVSFTVTTLNKEINKFLEPGAPSAENRIKCLELISEKYPEIHTGIFIMPIVPYLTDDDETLEEIIKRSKEGGAECILFSSMTMRDFQAVFFLSKIEEKYPELVKKYNELYNANFSSEIAILMKSMQKGEDVQEKAKKLKSIFECNYTPKMEYVKKINEKVVKLCKKYDIKYRLNRYIPKDYRKLNYIISQYLCDMAYERQIQGKYYNHLLWAGLNIGNLKESIQNIANRNELKSIKSVNDKIIELIKPFLKSNTLESFFKKSQNG
ncbi:MAG: radical SAM protein [Candidatus Helarchaeota archaeon]